MGDSVESSYFVVDDKLHCLELRELVYASLVVTGYRFDVFFLHGDAEENTDIFNEEFCSIYLLELDYTLLEVVYDIFRLLFSEADFLVVSYLDFTDGVFYPCLG